MAREKIPDVMGKILSKPEAKKSQKKTVSLPDAEDEPMKIFSLRMTVTDWKLLKTYFKSNGLDLSNGLRLWIIAKMREEGLK